MLLRRRPYIILLLLAVLALTAWGAAAAFTAPTQLRAAATTCRATPLSGVHDPQRLQILQACATFAGTVVKGAHTYADGDSTVNVAPDPAYASMLNDKNRHEGGIHVEIIPIDQPGCKSACTGANVRTPPLGAHVRVTGAWVYDRWVGWNEIHPTWKVELLSGKTPPPPPPPPPPQKAQAVQLKAWMVGRELGRQGARGGHGRIVLEGRRQWRLLEILGACAPRRPDPRLDSLARARQAWSHRPSSRAALQARRLCGREFRLLQRHRRRDAGVLRACRQQASSAWCDPRAAAALTG